MEVDAPNSEPATSRGTFSSEPSQASSLDAASPQVEFQTVEECDGAGAADEPPSPAADDAAERFERENQQRENFNRLSEIIVGCTEPSIKARKWDDFLQPNGRLRIDMPPSQFVEALEEEFEAEALIDLGFYIRNGDELELPSWLDGDAPLYVTPDADNCTFTFSRGDEFLFPMTRTALDYALERDPHASIHEPVTLYVVESQDAVEIMRGLGLPAVDCQGLEELGRDDILRLFADEQHVGSAWRYYLLLVDFDLPLLRNQPSAIIREAIQRLADAAKVYDLDPRRRFGVCRPTEREFEQLELAISFREFAKIRQLFENWSTAAKTAGSSSWETYLNTDAPSFSATRAALACALERPNKISRRDAVRLALPAYRTAGKAPVVRKFHDAMERANDPFDQIDFVAAAHYAETFFENDPLVRAAEAILADKDPASDRELQEESSEQQRQCMMELRRIRRDRKVKR